MACMYGRYRRVVGVGVRCVWRWRMVCYGVCMALGRRIYGVCRRWCALGVYGVQALGVRVYGVVWCTCVWCTLCVSFYDVT